MKLGSMNRYVHPPLLRLTQSLLVLLYFTNWLACIPCCESAETSGPPQTAVGPVAAPSSSSSSYDAYARENSLGQDIKDFIGILSALRERLWEVLFSPTMIAKAMPNMVSFLPNLVGGVLTNILELVIDYGVRLIKWLEPSTETLEVTGRYLSESFLGRLFQWDALDSGLRLMRVRRSCRPKAACECGAYLLSRNNRVARFLRAMRLHFVNASSHWPAMMSGLRGESCDEAYSVCEENFIDSSSQPITS